MLTIRVHMHAVYVYMPGLRWCLYTGAVVSRGLNCCCLGHCILTIQCSRGTTNIHDCSWVEVLSAKCSIISDCDCLLLLMHCPTADVLLWCKHCFMLSGLPAVSLYVVCAPLSVLPYWAAIFHHND